MSHFLTNLALRSMGMAETIMPRLPSLFEPSHVHGGLAAHPGLFLSKRDEELLQQDTPVSAAQAPIDHQHTRQRPPASDLTAPEFGGPETIKADSSKQASRATVVNQAKSPDHIHSQASRRPLEKDAPLSAPKLSFLSESPRSESLPRSGQVQVDSVRFPAASPGRHHEKEALDGMEKFRFEHRSPPIQAKPHFSSSQARSQQYTTSQPLLQAALSTHPAPKANRTVEPMPAPRRPVTRSAVASHSNPPEPTIRVTIGRVEVRAVFSDAPVRRVSPTQSRPTLTLDEYLKRSSRGRR